MKRRGLFVGLGVLLVGVTVCSLLLGSSSAQSRLAALPVHAQVVYNNETPDWFLSFFPMFGVSEDEFSRHWNEHFRALENLRLAVATVPFGGRERRDTWVAVSELGGSAALALRWRLMLFPPDEVVSVRPYAVWSVWRFEHASLPAWAKVRFSITESLLICSISTDSHDIYRLLDAADGRAESKLNRRRK